MAEQIIQSGYRPAPGLETPEQHKPRGRGDLDLSSFTTWRPSPSKRGKQNVGTSSSRTSRGAVSPPVEHTSADFEALELLVSVVPGFWFHAVLLPLYIVF